MVAGIIAIAVGFASGNGRFLVVFWILVPAAVGVWLPCRRTIFAVALGSLAATVIAVYALIGRTMGELVGGGWTPARPDRFVRWLATPDLGVLDGTGIDPDHAYLLSPWPLQLLAGAVVVALLATLIGVAIGRHVSNRRAQGANPGSRVG
jgi:hypothetical protein